MKKLFTFIICLAIFGIANSQTNVSGTISSDSTWDISGSPYIVTGYLTVANGATLIVDPNVEVQFNNNQRMYVNGALNATNATFTSSDPSPYPGIWQYIQFGNSTYSGQGLLLSCQFEYAQKLYVYNGTVTINNSTIGNFYYYGIESYDTVNIQSTSIDLENYHTSYGNAIYARTGGVIDINDVQITHCRRGLHIDGGSSVDMYNFSSISSANEYAAMVYGTLNMTDVNIDMLGYTMAGHGIYANNANIQLTNVNITNCNYGIYFYTFASVTLTNCTVALCEWPLYFNGPGSLLTIGTNDFTGNTRDAANIHFATLSSNWSLPYINVPYYFYSSFTVNNGYILDIASDNILKFPTSSYGLFINGTLIANADPGNNIYFTSDRDDNWGGDTNNDGSSTSPASGDWYGIAFNDQSNDLACILRKCKIRFAGRSSRGAIDIIDANPTIDSCDLSNNYYGVKIQNASNPTFTNNTIGSSQMTPIALSYEAIPVFSGNVLSFSDNEYDAIGLLGGTMTADAILPVRNISATPNITYLMLDNITVPSGLTLTINKGVVVKAYGYYDNRKFIIQGKISAIGTPDSMIVFTSARDDNFGNPFDTNKDGSQTSPTIGDWGGIVFNVNSHTDSKLEYCRIYYGDNNDYYIYPTISPSARRGGQITIDNANPDIVNCDIKHNEYGIYCGGDSQPIIWNNSFDNSTSTPIAISITAAPDLIGNTIVNPGYYALGIIGEELGVTGSLTQKNFAGYSNITYLLLEDLYINSGTEVTADSGVVIKVNTHKRIEVNGGLKTIAPVTSSGKVVFTSLKDDNEGNPGDTNNDGSSTSPAAGDWGRIQFNETSDDAFCSLEEFKVKYGGYGNDGAVACISANTNILDGEIYFSSNYGFFINGSSIPVIDYVIIQNCTTDPIAMSLKSDPQLTNISFIGNGSNGIRIIEGTLSSNATLAKRDVAGINNIAYLVYHLTISSNAVLTIEPGVVIKFPYDGYYGNKGYIIIDGGLSVDATFNEPAIFTSDRDDSYGGDTNNDGNATTPNKGDWNFVKFNNSGLSYQNYLNNCVFSYGGQYRSSTDYRYAKDFGLVNINNTSVVIDSCVFEQGIYSGIGIYGNADPTISNSQFNNITYTPVTISMFSEPVFGNNQISNIGLTAIGITIENYSVSATVTSRDFAGFQNITYVLYNYNYSSYLVQSSINSGTIITVPPGIIFKYKNIYGSEYYEKYSRVLDINGGLIINGIASQPVIFTDHRDDLYGNPMDTNGDGTSTEPSVNDNYILNFTEISDDPNCQINHTILKYQNYAIQIQQASPGINACTFENNNWGITMSGVSEPVIDSCNFYNLTYTPFQYSLVSYPISTVNNTISGTTYRALGIKGETMAQDVTLPKRGFGGLNNIPYYFHDNFTIGTSSIMTIEPGVTLKFNDNKYLTVKKGLIAEGGSTPDSTIVFTEIRDDYYGGDTNADSTATQPGHSYNPYQDPWRGIVFENESNDALCRLDHCIIRYAGYNYSSGYPGIKTNSASPVISNSTIYRNRTGIQANGASNPIVNNCDIYENQIYGLENAGMAFNINAENCWWGNNNGPTHSGNPGGTGDEVTDMVDYDPWQTSGANNPLMGDVSLNGSITAYDGSLVLLYVVDPVTYPLSPKQQMVADVSGNGTVTAYDASLILQYVVGFINYFPAELLCPLPNLVSEVELVIGNEEVEPGEEFSLPVSIANVSGVFALEMSIDYDPEFLEAMNVENLLLDMNVTFSINEEDGLIKVAFAGTESLEDDLMIANINFKATEEPANGVVTSVKAKFFMANETDLTWNVHNGSVSINGLATGFGDTFENEDKLLNCYPNPFTHNLNIIYTVLVDGEHVFVTVYDMYGQEVAEVVNGKHDSASYNILWKAKGQNGLKLTTGTYFIRMISGNNVETQKVQVVR